ncbi:hypothetical protein GCM10023334_028660 [Nonomuraea thailandensis]
MVVGGVQVDHEVTEPGAGGDQMASERPAHRDAAAAAAGRNGFGVCGARPDAQRQMAFIDCASGLAVGGGTVGMCGWCHGGVARLPGAPGPCHLSKYRRRRPNWDTMTGKGSVMLSLNGPPELAFGLRVSVQVPDNVRTETVHQHPCSEGCPEQRRDSPPASALFAQVGEVR